MRRLFKKRPSGAMIVAMVALIAAVGGTAYAASKIGYKALSKETRNKVLPVSSTRSITADCDPSTPTTFLDCTSLSFNWSKAFPRKTMLVVDGTFTTAAGGGRGECRLELDGVAIAGSTVKIGENGAGGHVNDNGDGWGINTITTAQGGQHSYSVACNETAGNITIRQLQLSGLGLRG
jgi:hypothetical protein